MQAVRRVYEWCWRHARRRGERLFVRCSRCSSFEMYAAWTRLCCEVECDGVCATPFERAKLVVFAVLQIAPTFGMDRGSRRPPTPSVATACSPGPVRPRSARISPLVRET